MEHLAEADYPLSGGGGQGESGGPARLARPAAAAGDQQPRPLLVGEGFGLASSFSSSGGQLVGDKYSLSWVDALAGVRFRAPLGSRAAFLGRVDVAGFGSKVTWNLSGDLAVGLSERWTVGAGWRYLDIDYEKGSGLTASNFNLAYTGPRLWFAYTW